MVKHFAAFVDKTTSDSNVKSTTPPTIARQIHVGMVQHVQILDETIDVRVQLVTLGRIAGL